MTTVTLDGTKMQNIANSSHSAHVAVENLAGRQRLRHTSDITRMRNQLVRDGEKIVDGDFMKFWKDLEEANVGSIVYGRRGKPDRFEWFYNLKSVAKAAIEGSNEIAKQIKSTEKMENTNVENQIKTKKKRGRKPKSEKREVKSDSLVMEKIILIPLRMDYSLEIKVPSNVTKKEIQLITSSLSLLG